MSSKEPLAVTLYLLSGTFTALAALFIGWPEEAAAVYGLSNRDPASLFYVRAIGFRDLALAVYLIGLTLNRQRRALFVVLTGTLLIPIGDVMLLAWSGAGRPVHYLLHGVSLLCFAGLAFWTSRVGSAR